jgi:hypothetical protein
MTWFWGTLTADGTTAKLKLFPSQSPDLLPPLYVTCSPHSPTLIQYGNKSEPSVLDQGFSNPGHQGVAPGQPAVVQVVKVAAQHSSSTSYTTQFPVTSAMEPLLQRIMIERVLR